MKKYIAFVGVLICFAFAKALPAQSIERIEPPNWWAGMEHSAVELMIYGENVGNGKVWESDLLILKTRKTENPNYLFLTLETRGASVGTHTLIISVGEKYLSIDYELKPREKNSRLRKGFDSSDVIYLVMPDRFANGDTSNDSVDGLAEKANRDFKGGRHGGDIQGIIDHLDYIDDLGATAIWSTPVQEDNEERYSYHTYAISDLYKIDARYGTNEDYRRLAHEMHQRDMKLIMDMVPNHWGAAHWMMKDLPSKDWIHYFEDNDFRDDLPLKGFSRSNYRQTTQFDPYTSENDERYAEKGWFDTTMPDMNTENELFLNYMIQNAIWWVEYAGLDGIRVDTYAYNEKEGIAKWTKAIMDEYPYFNILGETWLYETSHVSYWQKDSPVAAIQHYNSYLPTVMDKPLNVEMLKAFKENEGSWDKGLVRIYNTLANDFLYPDTDNIVILAGNHDTNRINGDGVFNGDLDSYKLVMTLLMTTRGIPQIYYGDEIGMGGNRDTDGDGDIRRDFPGGWSGDKINAFTQPTKTQKTYQNFTKKLLNYRKDQPLIHTGTLTHFVPEENCYVYFRHDDEQKIMVVLNNNPEEVTLDLNRFREMLAATNTGKEIISGNQVSLSNTLKVTGKTPMIIELD
ncbi:MAG: glycoside hydrolase family 13 protein [Nonlabens sp.]